jgi:putative Mg2+ transporter-C (MgtC) family protein
VSAFFWGGLIGWFREKEGKTAGMRTHILVSLGSALFMVLSLDMLKFGGAADPGRIAAGVVTGIGFLGAGCIVQTGSGVRGITTAASIWVTSAIGIAAGAGLYVESATATVLTVAALQLLREIERRFIKTKSKEE